MFKVKYRYTSIEKLFLVMLIVFPLDFINIEFMGIGWSMGRILFVILFFIMIPIKAMEKRILDKSSILGLLGILSIFSSLIATPHIDWYLVKFFMPSFVVGVGAFVLSYVTFVDNAAMIYGFKYVIRFWMALIILFSIYSFYSFYVLSEVPLRNYLADHAVQVGASGRFFLPTATPPHLSLFASITGIWAIAYYIRQKKTIYLLLFLSLFFINVLTFSRSGFLSLILTLTAYSAILFNLKLIKISPTTAVFLGVGLLIVLWFPRFQDLISNNLGNEFAYRITTYNIEQIQAGAHYYYRRQAFEIFYNASFFQKIWGIGVGNFESIEIGSTYAFSIYLTTLAELGLFGATIFTCIFALPPFLFYKKLKKHSYLRFPYFLGFGLSMILFLGNLFYEYKVFVPMWITVAWLHALANSRVDLIEEVFATEKLPVDSVIKEARFITRNRPAKIGRRSFPKYIETLKNHPKP